MFLLAVSKPCSFIIIFYFSFLRGLRHHISLFCCLFLRIHEFFSFCIFLYFMPIFSFEAKSNQNKIQFFFLFSFLFRPKFKNNHNFYFRFFINDSPPSSSRLNMRRLSFMKTFLFCSLFFPKYVQFHFTF